MCEFCGNAHHIRDPHIWNDPTRAYKAMLEYARGTVVVKPWCPVAR